MTANSGSYTLNVGSLGVDQTSCFLNNFDSDSEAFREACKTLRGEDAFCRQDFLPPINTK